MTTKQTAITICIILFNPKLIKTTIALYAKAGNVQIKLNFWGTSPLNHLMFRDRIYSQLLFIHVINHLLHHCLVIVKVKILKTNG